ncbi:hypothetical protein SAMN05216351_1115 [Pseudobutyrivibrio sp. JW11]|uniref:hypothetical protein n=1 Tax=Pseudobutyrivibrio sp. JW11 TaxID=1855302 RepID=UPI0008EEA509|nr:hypothetical protein [Pseudobutyrivibrio sp. JW11]SFO46266.1 hypothetical protein SAMN05216351_1115 [Pseudobutyrivibrio sp. JW11]
MNKLFKRAVSFAAIAVMVFAFNIVAMAQGTTTINVSKSSASVGDSITVSITATESGTITVKYTASMLSLSSCSVSGYTSEGNAVSFSGKSGDIVFSAAAEGTASIIVSSSANSGSSTTLTIGGSSSSSSTSTASESTTEETTTTEETVEENTETTEETTEETPAATTSASGVGTLNSDGGFDIDGVAYVVSERFSDSDMPAGFSKTTVTIGSSTYSEPTNGSLTLLYLKPADNTSGSGVFYLYNAEAGTVSPFLMLGTADSYVIVSDNGSAPTSAFTATTLDVNGGTATAYTIDGAEFFYVYGTNQDGASGWFVYDSTYKTVSRVDESALSTSASTDTTEEVEETETSTDNNLYVEKLNLYRKIIMGLIVLCVVLLFIIINKAIRGHGDDDDFDGDVFAKAPTKSSRRLPRSIVFGGKDRGEEDDEYDDEEYEEEEYDDDDEEEYDDYDEDDEDDDRDFSKSRFESESYEARRASSLNMMDLNDL